jgi:ABC-2 type transport system ATP-binding protein
MRMGRLAWISWSGNNAMCCYAGNNYARRVDLAIEVRDLHKSYAGPSPKRSRRSRGAGPAVPTGPVEAVRGIDLEVPVGQVFALLGPNGAGKTTSVEIMEGYRDRTSGTVSVLGYDPAKGEKDFKRRIGIVLQETGVQPFLTVSEAVEMNRGYYPHPRPLDEVIEVVGLTEKADTRVLKLSGGQQRRLDVAIGLAGDPELLFLDEPTTGFDPAARRNAWAMIENLKSLGKTIFLTTHYMDEAQNLADRVAIIVDGKIVAEGPPRELAGQDTTRTQISFTVPGAAQDLLVAFASPGGAHDLPHPDTAWSVSDHGHASLSTTEPVRVLHDLTTWALERGVDLEGLSVLRPSLEDVYLELTAPADQKVAP